MTHKKLRQFLYLSLFVIVLTPSLAHAYIGPAIVFLGYLLAPVGALLATIFMFLYAPVKRYIRKRKKAKTHMNKTDISTKKEPASLSDEV